MAIVYMQRVNLSGGQYSATSLANPAYEHSDTVAAPGNGNSVIVPADVKGISVTLKITGGQAKVQTTTDTIANVLDDSAEWVDWDAGDVATTTQDYAVPVTAIRQVNASGTSVLQLRAQ